MTLEQFEQMPNAAKRDHIAKVPIADLFMPVLDTDFRNGIGHHAAHYEQDPDAIVIFDTKDAGTVSRVMGYTEFCEKDVRTISYGMAYESEDMCRRRPAEETPRIVDDPPVPA